MVSAPCIDTNVSLLADNVLGLPTLAEFLCQPRNEEEVLATLAWARSQGVTVRVLGSGTNIVCGPVLSGLIISTKRMRALTQHSNDHGTAYVAGAGTSWQSVCDLAITSGHGGFECMTGIPGTVGAALYQNIGAYGSELSDVLVSVRVIDQTHPERGVQVHSAAWANLSYRWSRLQDEPTRWIVTGLHLQSRSDYNPNWRYDRLRTALGASAQSLEQRWHDAPSHETRARVLREVQHTVEGLRATRLPSLQSSAHVGSFFKNPVLNEEQIDAVRKLIPGVEHWQDASGSYRMRAATVMEHLSLLGVSVGPWCLNRQNPMIICADRQALASAATPYADLQSLVREIVTTWTTRVGIEPRVEPTLWP